MNKKIFGGIFGVSAVVLVLSVAFIMGILYDYFSIQNENQMEYEAKYIAVGIEAYGMDYLNDLKTKNPIGNRITWIDADGNVLFDNMSEADSMKNHSDREEIQEALSTGTGRSSRYSSTLSEQTVYYATRLSDGTILRLSVTRSTLFTLFIGVIQPVLLVLTAAVIISVFISLRISKKIVEPLNNMNLDEPDGLKIYDEMAPFLTKIKKQNTLIDIQMRELRRQQSQFKLITDNMKEGFIVIDNKTEVLSYNRSALDILDINREFLNQSILAMNRSEPLRVAVDKALSGRRNEQHIEINGRVYSIIANPVFYSDTEPGADANQSTGTGAGEGEGVTGVVIALIDVTEMAARDRLRKEFTANVSHELKTPLTSILGFAELMKAGMAKPEDMAGFAENIYNEARRLISLIDDILKLSRIEEGAELPEKENVELSCAVLGIVKRLEQTAVSCGVTVTSSGEDAHVYVVPQILDEVLFNIIENAIKYNKEGGDVNVFTGFESGRAAVIVSDTGIGIPREEQARVFERFYRVDKAHSRNIGGTGLGLSIVKHGVQMMDAEIFLESHLNEGTTVKILFH